MCTTAICLHGGTIYGWPNMRTILRRDGVLLSPTCASNMTSLCEPQELEFGIIYTAGAWSNQAARLIIGVALDHLGPRVTGVTSTLVCGCGSALVALTSSAPSLTAGFFLVGGGGAGVQLAVQSCAALFPRHRSTVMSILSGAFQFASGIYLVFELLHRSAGLSLRALLLFQSVVAAAVALGLYAMLPDLAFGLARKRTSGRELSCPAGCCASSTSTPPTQTSTPSQTSGLDEKLPPLHQRSFRAQFLSPETFTLLLFFAVGVLQCQFTVATIGVQLERKGDVDGAATRYFGTCMACVFLWTPLLGLLTDRLGFVLTLAMTNGALLLAMACLLVPSLPLTYLGSLLYALGRVSLWASYFAYNAHVFGFRHFGKLVGVGMTLAACFSLLMYPLLALTITALDSDFTLANSLFVGMHSLTFLLLPRLGRGARDAAAAYNEAAPPAKTEAEPGGVKEDQL